MVNKVPKTYSLSKEMIRFIKRQASKKDQGESEYVQKVLSGHINKIKAVVKYHREAHK